MKIILMIFLFTSQVFAQTQSFELLPSDDTYVTSEAVNSNYGDSAVLDLKTYHAGTRLLLKFDENEIKSLLENYDLVSARLELPLKLHWVHGECSIGLYKMKEPWSEESATWNKPDQNQSATWLMYSHDPNNTIPYPYEMSPFASGNISPEQEMPVSFDVTGYVRDLSTDAFQNFGMAVFRSATSVSDPVAFYSKESDIQPKIILTVTPKIVAPTELEAKLTVNQSSGVLHLLVHFDASESKVESGKSIAKFELNFGDGSTVLLDKNNPVIDHSYTTEGDFLAILNMTTEEDSLDLQIISEKILVLLMIMRTV